MCNYPGETFLRPFCFIRIIWSKAKYLIILLLMIIFSIGSFLISDSEDDKFALKNPLDNFFFIFLMLLFSSSVIISSPIKEDTPSKKFAILGGISSSTLTLIYFFFFHRIFEPASIRNIIFSTLLGMLIGGCLNWVFKPKEWLFALSLWIPLFFMYLFIIYHFFILVSNCSCWFRVFFGSIFGIFIGYSFRFVLFIYGIAKGCGKKCGICFPE